jgi:hypothetical protein
VSHDTWIIECPDVEAWRARIEAHLAVDDLGCWVWTGSLDSGGYGKFRATIDGRKRSLSAHRAAWLAFRGSIPYPLVPDHLCRNRACVNPEHMEVVTGRVNTQRGLAGQGPRPRAVRGCGRHGTERGYVHTTQAGRSRWVCQACQEIAREAYRARCA